MVCIELTKSEYMALKAYNASCNFNQHEILRMDDFIPEVNDILIARKVIYDSTSMKLEKVQITIIGEIKDITFNEYQRFAESTALYDLKIIYPALGLCGESGEVAEKIKKMIRDDNWILTKERRELIIKELGDVLWYLAMIANDIGVPLNDIASNNINKLSSRKDRNKLQGDGDLR